MTMNILSTLLVLSGIISSALGTTNETANKVVFDNKSLTNCASVNPTAILISGSLTPDIITIPGTGIVTADIVFTKPLPSDLRLRLLLTKLPALTVPCFTVGNGSIGSCEYDVCDMISYPGVCSALLPPELGCKCPLAAGTYTLPNIKLNIPAMMPPIPTLMTGNYIGQAIMYSNSNKNWTVGCLEFRFALTAS